MDEFNTQVRLALLQLDRDQCVRLTQEYLGKGLDPLAVLEHGFMPAMRELGTRFSQGDLFLPELVIASDIMKECTALLERSLLQQGEQRTAKATIVIGTVEGDIHDIGKTIVCSMLNSAGFRVVDIGTDVPASMFLEAAERESASIIAQSALLTTTAIRQADLVQLLKEKGVRDKYRIMVGGAAVSKDWARQIGADAYGADAAAAVKEADRLVSSITP